MAVVGPVKNVAIIGATGNLGKFFVDAILSTNNHKVTALTRPDSTKVLPQDVHRVPVDFEDHKSVVAALEGQQFLIIILGITSIFDTQSKIYKAAAEAGVKYIMPSFYGFDPFDTKAMSEGPGSGMLKSLQEIEQMGMSWIHLACSVWYEWSLALGNEWFGLDIDERKATFFDNGRVKVFTSTWPQCGRAVASLLSLPESSTSPSLSDWKNKAVYIKSFHIDQRAMLDSLHRVLGTTDTDWDIKYEPLEKRASDGLAEFAEGRFKGMAKNSYAKHFIRSKEQESESPKAFANDVLGLPKEELDEATKQAVIMVASGWNPLPGHHR